MIEIPLSRDIKPVKFYGYTSTVNNRFLVINCMEENSLDLLYNNLRDELLELFKTHNVDCSIDNKIVFEIDVNGTRIFIGFYDWRINIGLSVNYREGG